MSMNLRLKELLVVMLFLRLSLLLILDFKIFCEIFFLLYVWKLKNFFLEKEEFLCKFEEKVFLMYGIIVEVEL